MPIQGYTPNRNLIHISPGSTDNWDVWYNDTLNLLDEPSILYKITAAENLNQGEVAAILDDGSGAKKAYLAASGTYTLGDPLGLATETVTAGSPLHLALAGRVQSNGWSFGSADKFVYLSASGAVTTTQTGVQVGYALSSSSIYFRQGSGSSSGGQTNGVAGTDGIINTGDNVDAVLAPTYGTSAATICEGNDSRLHTRNADQGTDNSFFEINYSANSARMMTTGLTANRDYTFPDATTKLIGESASATITADHDYSGGTLRVPTNAGAPSGANDEGDMVFDTTNDDLYVGQGGVAWEKVNYRSRKNVVINGGGSVAQRGDYTLVKDVYGFGKCDRFGGMATGTAVSAGALTQSTTAPVGRTGYAFKFSGVTLTGAGVIYLRTRIESRDAKGLKNQSASLSVKVYHDIGSAVIFTLYIRKANSADNFSAVTQISSDGGTSVNSATATTLKLENVGMGDCSNGIEIEIKAAVGAITAKNVYITEVQLEQGTTAGDFENEDVATTVAKCQRYYWILNPATGGQVIFAQYFDASRTGAIYLTYPVEMRASPTTTINGTWSMSNVSAFGVYFAQPNNASLFVNSSGAGWTWVAATNMYNTVTFSSEL